MNPLTTLIQSAPWTKKAQNGPIENHPNNPKSVSLKNCTVTVIGNELHIESPFGTAKVPVTPEIAQEIIDTCSEDNFKAPPAPNSGFKYQPEKQYHPY